MEKTRSLFGNIIEYILLSISIVFFNLKIVFLCVVFLPVYIFRFFVSKIKVLGPKLGNIITSRTAMFAIDPLFTDPGFTVLQVATLNGDSPDIVNYLRNIILDKIINVRKKNGELKYEEMQQYPYQWMGFLFWKWDEKFDISNHVNFYSSPDIDKDSKVTQSQMHKIQYSLLLKPYTKNRTPWEILIVRNVESENSDESRSVLLFRIHHSIGDGVSLMHIVFETLIQSKISKNEFLSKPKVIKRSYLSGLLYCIKNIFLAPCQFAKYNLQSSDNNDWVVTGERARVKTIIAVSDKMSTADLKEIADFHKVGLSAVIFAGLTAALRKAMMKRFGSVPKYIHLCSPAFAPGHPDKLTNHMAIVSLRLPTGIPGSIERLKKQHTNLDFLKNSVVATVAFYVMPLFGALFPSWTRSFTTKPSCTLGASSFPGPKRRVFIDNQEIIDLYYYQGHCGGHLAMCCNFLTYSDGLRLTITTDASVLENEDKIKELMLDIKEEFCLLKNGIYV